MSTLQLGLIIAGIALVIGVVIYNAWQERRLRRRMAPAFKPAPAPVHSGSDERRVEPTLGESSSRAASDESAAHAGVRAPTELPASPFAIPMEDVAMPVTDVEDVEAAEAAAAYEVPAAAVQTSFARAPGTHPDPDIETMATLAPAHAVAAAEIAPGLQARLGKPLRWFGRTGAGAPWQLVSGDSDERYVELVACLLLADRNGPLSSNQMEAFLRLVHELAGALDASVDAGDAPSEVQRAEALDRLCAELDVQIGLTLHKPEPGAVPGTKLRGVAEAAGFQLAPGGRFVHLQEDTGAVLYTLQGVRNEPFTAESLRLASLSDVVFLLDVPRVADPARSFDQMKLCARRMAHSLGAQLVDDNRRPLDDAALAKIRAQVQAAAEALAEVHIEPGSPRAAALFGA